MNEKVIEEENKPKILVDLDEFEDDERQTYKYLYGILQEKFEQLQDDIKKKEEEQFNAYDVLQDRERELSQVKDELAAQKDLNEKLRGTADTLREFIDKFIDQEITVVKDVKAIDASSEKEITCNSDTHRIAKELSSDMPGIYLSHRPSWFTPLGAELNKENAAEKTAKATMPLFKEKLHFWKTRNKKLEDGTSTVEEVALEYDSLRQQKILDLLRDNCSNEEKYIKYMLLTPGMPKDFLQTFTGAAELGLDANVIIELLEQPNDLYNQEIIEIYVSEVHKGTEYNLKKELAEELVRGEWYVRARINGKDEKLQLVPLEMINELKRKLDNISKFLLNVPNDISNEENNEPDEVDMDDIQQDNDIPVIGKENSVAFDAFLDD